MLATPVALGAYAFAFRVRAGSRAWVYCDADGSANGFEVAQAGRLTVASPEITNCTLQDLSASTAMSGERLVGRVRVFIPATTISAGAATGLIAQVGVGAAGVNASTSAQWGWRGARFAGDIAASGEDEFSSEFTRPTPVRGPWLRVPRPMTRIFWVYCDRDGSQNGHSIQQQWALTVNTNTDFSWCNTHYPAPPQQYLRTDAGPTLIFPDGSPSHR